MNFLQHRATISLIAFLTLAPVAFASTSQAADRNEVRVPVTTVSSSLQDGLNGTIVIRLGKSQPFRVMLDTGSVGLRLFPAAPQVGIGKKETQTDLPNGDRVRAVVGKAKISIGKTQTTQAITYQRIPQTNPWINGWQNQNVLGILGIGLKDSAVPNPLRYLPGKQGLVWSVKFSRAGVGSLVLGDSIPTNSLMHFPLPVDGNQSVGNPENVWNDHAAPGCWTFQTPGRKVVVERVEYCVNTWFDSGFPIMRIKGAQFKALKLTPTQALVPDTEVRLAAPGSAFAPATFRASDQGSRNTTRVADVGRSVINTGNSFFFDYRVYYSVATGDIYLTKDVSEKVSEERGAQQ